MLQIADFVTAEVTREERKRRFKSSNLQVLKSSPLYLVPDSICTFLVDFQDHFHKDRFWPPNSNFQSLYSKRSRQLFERLTPLFVFRIIPGVLDPLYFHFQPNLSGHL